MNHAAHAAMVNDPSIWYNPYFVGFLVACLVLGYLLLSIPARDR